MALKIELKPRERFILGDSVITNDDQRTRLFIEGNAPILREKDILRPEEADTPCKNIYLVVQLMYLSPDPSQFYKDYFSLIRDVQKAAPSLFVYIDRINNEILTGSLYKALKAGKALIEAEEERLKHATSDPGLLEDSDPDRDATRSGGDAAGQGG